MVLFCAGNNASTVPTYTFPRTWETLDVSQAWAPDKVGAMPEQDGSDFVPVPVPVPFFFFVRHHTRWDRWWVGESGVE